MRIYLHLFNYILENAKALPEVCMKKLFLKFLQYSQENNWVGFSFNLGSCKIFKNTYVEEHLQTAASDNVFTTLRKMKNCWWGFLTQH